MSAFDRHPLRFLYAEAAKQMPPRNALEILQAMRRQAQGHKVRIPSAKHLSAQNRRVRFAVDLDQARQRCADIPIPNTRQVRRQVARMGPAAYAVSAQQLMAQQVGPDEV